MPMISTSGRPAPYTSYAMSTSPTRAITSPQLPASGNALRHGIVSSVQSGFGTLTRTAASIAGGAIAAASIAGGGLPTLASTAIGTPTPASGRAGGGFVAVPLSSTT